MTFGKTDEQIEQLFWKSISLAPPLYGADTPGSLMKPGAPWNLSELNTHLKTAMEVAEISGVTSPYLYYGSWKTMFGWHKEDMDLCSINVLHSGSPKFWYSIDLDSNQDFEEFSRSKFPQQAEKCNEFLRHKNTMIHPKVLLRAGIKVRKITQRPGDFIVI